MPIVLPKFHESLMENGDYKKEFEQKLQLAYQNAFCKNYLKLGLREGILSDMAGALGKIHDTVVHAAIPNFIAREIIDVRTTTEALERFPLEKESVAYVASEGGTVRIHGARYSTVDINCNIEIKDGVEWTKQFAEDAKWNVMQRQLEALGRSIAKIETEKITGLFAGIAVGDLATGTALNGEGTTLSWSKTVALWDALESEDLGPADVLALHPKQASQLFTATEFINSQYLPSSETELTRGLVGQALTMRIHKSSAGTTNGVAHSMNKSVAGVMLIRSDLTIEPYEDVKNGVVGLVARERIGYGILRSKTVARMTNIMTSLS
jgi:hypothetical protein